MVFHSFAQMSVLIKVSYVAHGQLGFFSLRLLIESKNKFFLLYMVHMEFLDELETHMFIYICCLFELTLFILSKRKPQVFQGKKPQNLFVNQVFFCYNHYNIDISLRM